MYVQTSSVFLFFQKKLITVLYPSESIYIYIICVLLTLNTRKSMAYVREYPHKIMPLYGTVPPFWDPGIPIEKTMYRIETYLGSTATEDTSTSPRHW